MKILKLNCNDWNFSGEASEVGDFNGSNSRSSSDEDEDDNDPESSVDSQVSNIIQHSDSEGDLEEEEYEVESEEGPFSDLDFVIYSSSSSTSSQEDFSQEFNSPDTTGYSLGDIEL